MSDELEARAQLLNTTIGRLNTDEALELITLTLREERRRVWEEVSSKPWLGNATTKELLDEIAARVDLDYRTVGPHKDPNMCQQAQEEES